MGGIIFWTPSSVSIHTIADFPLSLEREIHTFVCGDPSGKLGGNLLPAVRAGESRNALLFQWVNTRVVFQL